MSLHVVSNKGSHPLIAQQQFIERCLLTYQAHLSRPSPTWPWQVQALVRCIHEKLFEETLTVTSLFEACGIRDKNISSRFAGHLGMCPKSYIIFHRLEVAKELLPYEELAITQIALGVGYTGSGAFSSAFKKHVGCTPTAFRKRRNGKK